MANSPSWFPSQQLPLSLCEPRSKLRPLTRSLCNTYILPVLRSVTSISITWGAGLPPHAIFLQSRLQQTRPVVGKTCGLEGRGLQKRPGRFRADSYPKTASSGLRFRVPLAWRPRALALSGLISRPQLPYSQVQLSHRF